MVIRSFNSCRVKVFAHTVFFVFGAHLYALNCQMPLKMLATDAKNAENQTHFEFFNDGRKYRSQCVNVIDKT